jgi:AraC-like DNA-binding protein
MVVKLELEKLGLYCNEIELGRVDTTQTPSPEQIDKFRIALLNSGLELLENKRNILIEKIKNTIIEMVYNIDSPLRTNFSDYLSKKLNFDYTYLANIFSDTTGTTIEQFIIRNRIQRAKELIWCNEFTLTEISWKLHFSSVAHLSSQFKKVTGFTPSHYKNSPLSNFLQLQNV